MHLVLDHFSIFSYYEPTILNTISNKKAFMETSNIKELPNFISGDTEEVNIELNTEYNIEFNNNNTNKILYFTNPTVQDIVQELVLDEKAKIVGVETTTNGGSTTVDWNEGSVAISGVDQ